MRTHAELGEIPTYLQSLPTANRAIAHPKQVVNDTRTNDKCEEGKSQPKRWWQ